MAPRCNLKTILLTVFVFTLTFIVFNDHVLNQSVTTSGDSSSSSISKVIDRSVVKVKVRRQLDEGETVARDAVAAEGGRGGGEDDLVLLEGESKYTFTSADVTPPPSPAPSPAPITDAAVPTAKSEAPPTSLATPPPPAPSTTTPPAAKDRNMAEVNNSSNKTSAIGTLSPALPMDKRKNKCEVNNEY